MKNILFFILITISPYACFSYIKSENKLEVLRLNMRKQPKTLDPRKSADLYSFQTHFLLFEGLVKLYPDDSVKLAQAESYKISEDQLTYTFTLKDTVWSDNTPVTAYDFERTWKDILKPDFPSVNDYLFSPIKNADAAKKGLVPVNEVGIKAINSKTLVINLERPTPYFLKLLCFCAFFPVNSKNDKDCPNWAYCKEPEFLCNGPFLIESWDHGNKMTLKRNPKYRETDDLYPERIVFNFVENDFVSLQMFKQGSIDVIGDCLTDIPLEEIPDLEKNWTISRAPRARTAFISINTKRFPFNHPKIRKAFGFAINRQELIELTGSGVKKNISTKNINTGYQASNAATNIVPPCLKKNHYRSFFQDNDIVKARLLLEEGMADLGITREAFRPVILYYSLRYPESGSLIQVIQQQWLKVLGVSIKVESLDFNVMMDRLVNGDYFLTLIRRNPSYPDPMSILERFKYKTYATNFTNWENQKYIELLERSFYDKEDQRLLTLEEAEKIFINEMPVIPLYHEDYVYIVNPKIPYAIPVWWRDRMLLQLSKEEKEIQKENRNAYRGQVNCVP